VIEKVKSFKATAVKNQKDRKNAFKWIGAKGFSLDDEIAEEDPGAA
jgi:hypothetical protein